MVPQKNPHAAAQYLKTRVMTATPEQLQIMLYDGAVRFCEQARVGLESKHFEQLFINVTKAQNIVIELMTSLKPKIYPELCEKLGAVYKYVYKRLTEAGAQHNMESLEEALKLLKYQRETWVMVLEQTSKEKAGKALSTVNIPGPDPRMEASISMCA